MNRTCILRGAAGALALGGLLGVALPLAVAGPLVQDPTDETPTGVPQNEDRAEDRAEESGGLVQVKPFGGGQDAGRTTQLGLFDGSLWHERLTTSDLARREVWFERIVDQARVDPGAEAWLRERAADAAEPELAWTTRLALREAQRSLGHQRLDPFGMGRFGLGRDPFSGLGLDDPFGALGLGGGALDAEQLQKRIEDMLRRVQQGLLQPGAGGTSQQRSFQLEQDASGGARLRVSETVDGVEQTREYTGDSLEAILDQNPGLRDELGLGGGGSLGPGLRLQLGDDLFGFGGGLPGALPDAGAPQQPEPVPSVGQPQDRRYLGVFVTEVSDEVRERLSLGEGTGAMVQRTLPGSYAHLMGIAPGDVLVELNGEEVRGLETIGAVMAAREPNDPIDVVLYDAWDQVRERTWRP